MRKRSLLPSSNKSVTGRFAGTLVCSSRRRHTRYWRDWSSDVCSSDLVPNHEPALLQMHTGNVQPIRPSLGSWLLYGLGSENRNLPGYVVLRPTPRIVVGPALWSNSFLPAQYQATSMVTEDMAVEKLVANIRNPRLNAEQQREQLDLLARLNRLHLDRRGGDGELDGQIQAM